MMEQLKRIPSPVHIAIGAFATASAVTTLEGVRSVAPQSALPSNEILWGVVAMAVALGLAVSLSVLASKLYESFRVCLVAGMLIIGFIAAVFDTAFFQKSFATRHHEQTAHLEDAEAISKEHDRLLQATAGVRATLTSEIDKAIAAPLAERNKSEADARFEADETDEPGKRGKGARYKAAKQASGAAQAAIDRLESYRRETDAMPAAPGGHTWADLDRFYTDLARLVAATPYGHLVTLPPGPQRPSSRTDAGNAKDAGGLSLTIELLIKGDVTNPLFYVPVMLALFVEWGMLVMILAVRPWRVPTSWTQDRLERGEALTQQAPSPKEVALALWGWLLRGGDAGIRMQRQRQNVRVQTRRNQVRMERELAEIGDGKDAWAEESDDGEAKTTH